MTPRRALILAGSGMLADVENYLVRRGWHVVLPCRRYAPVDADDLEDTVVGDGMEPLGKALWVHADWTRPRQLAVDAEKALQGDADLLVMWVHDQFKDAVVDTVAPLLDADAPVVEVHGNPDAEMIRCLPEASFAGHTTQQVVLGHVGEQGHTRWPTHAETVDGVLVAVDRAISGKPPTVHQVGEGQNAQAVVRGLP
jgi:NAD(P)-dependent dehydrogenase (short-subunit alcohol dehydrogenase family)